MSVRILPHDKATENYVIGVLLQHGNLIDKVRELLPVCECFYINANECIYAVMLDLHKKGIGIDLFTVTDGLTKTNQLETIGGAYTLVERMNEVTTTANIENHALIIKEKYLKRLLIQSGQKAINLGYDDGADIFDAISEVTQSVKETNEHISNKGAKNIRTIIMAHQEDIDLRKTKPNDLLGVSSGIKNIDLLTNGFQAKDLCIIGARPSVGKTALALNIGLNASMLGFPTATFSLEMSTRALVSRLVSSLSEIELYKIKKPHLLNKQEFDKYIDITNRIANFDLSLDDNALLSPLTLRSKLNAISLDLAKKGKRLRLVVIDYLQLMKSDNKRAANREAVVSDISRELKIIASDMDLCILALSQVNRDVEKRNTQELFLSDLRESGAIEQDASMVGFLYSNDPEANTIRNMFFKIAKNRDGEVGTLELTFNKSIQKFSEKNVFAAPTQQHFEVDNPIKGIYKKDDFDYKQLPF